MGGWGGELEGLSTNSKKSVERSSYMFHLKNTSRQVLGEQACLTSPSKPTRKRRKRKARSERQVLISSALISPRMEDVEGVWGW